MMNMPYEPEENLATLLKKLSSLLSEMGPQDVHSGDQDMGMDSREGGEDAAEGEMMCKNCGYCSECPQCKGKSNEMQKKPLIKGKVVVMKMKGTE